MTSDSQLGAETRTNLKELWRAALGELQLAMPKANYDTWFKETYVVSEEDDVFCIGVPNAFAREWLENKYRTHVRASLQRLVGRTVDVRFITVPGGAAPAAGTGQRPSNPAYSGHNVDGSSASVTPVAPPSERRSEGAPVTAILIAYGSDADVVSLGKAAAAVHGRTYWARNPADIGKVFLAAMVNR